MLDNARPLLGDLVGDVRKFRVVAFYLVFCPHYHRGVVHEGARLEVRVGGYRPSVIGIANEGGRAKGGLGVGGIAFDGVNASYVGFKP